MTIVPKRDITVFPDRLEFGLSGSVHSIAVLPGLIMLWVESVCLVDEAYDPSKLALAGVGSIVDLLWKDDHGIWSNVYILSMGCSEARWHFTEGIACEYSISVVPEVNAHLQGVRVVDPDKFRGNPVISELVLTLPREPWKNFFLYGDTQWSCEIVRLAESSKEWKTRHSTVKKILCPQTS